MHDYDLCLYDYDSEDEPFHGGLHVPRRMRSDMLRIPVPALRGYRPQFQEDEVFIFPTHLAKMRVEIRELGQPINTIQAVMGCSTKISTIVRQLGSEYGSSVASRPKIYAIAGRMPVPVKPNTRAMELDRDSSGIVRLVVDYGGYGGGSRLHGMGPW